MRKTNKRFVILLPAFVCIALWSCQRPLALEEDYVEMTPADLVGTYVLEYEYFWGYDMNWEPTTLIVETDTFSMGFSADSSRLEWRSLTANKFFEFDVDVRALPVSTTEYLMASIPVWGEWTTYVGDANTQGIGWKVFPYEPIDEVERWSGYYKSTTHPTIILGSPLEAGNGLHHIYCGAYGSLQAEWTQRIRFRSCSRLD